MTTFQKVITYMALAFALFIIINILSGIFFGIYALGSILGLTQNQKPEIATGEYIETELNAEEISVFHIDLEYSNLEVKKGERFWAETNSKEIRYIQNGHELIIKENIRDWFPKKAQETLTIYIPEEMIFEVATIENNIGEIRIEQFKANEFSFKIGIGKATISNLVVLEEAEIDSGVGKADIQSGEINNLNLDMGVGEFELITKLTGNSKITAGIGRLNIRLLGEQEDYAIKFERGIGKVRLNGQAISKDTTYGNGSHYLKIDGGIGSIRVDIKK